MTVGEAAGGQSRNLILAAMIFAVAMTFIDQTIVSIAAPEVQKELGLTSTGVQWAVNAYLLSLAALFAFGGRLADTVGHRKMVTLGVIVFAGSSALCGLTPKGSLAEAWIVTFRVLQGAGGAIMFPAALAIVVQTFALRERGRALAIFFGIAGGLTAVGPILGGYLTQWTWRAIFWVLGIAMLVFVPAFFFASEYAQIALGKTPSEAGLYLLYFFIGFVIAAQVGGRMLDRRGAKRPVTLGCALGAVGFWLWAGKVTGLDFGAQQWYIILAGAGMGFMLGPASTDAVNRASKLSYGEATGITQTARNYAASLGLAILGTIQVSQMRSHVTKSLISQGIPGARAHAIASRISQSQHGSGSVGSIPHFVRLDFAYATRSVLYVMAAIMAAAAITALVGLRAGVQEEADATADPEGETLA
jgi:predicted MFS family arabinose efflux permease